MVEKIVQCSIKKFDGRTLKQRIYVSNDGDTTHMQIGVWKKNKFTNEVTVSFSKDELQQLLSNGE